MSIEAIEADEHSLTLGWDAVDGVIAYEIQMAPASDEEASTAKNGEDSLPWTTLSSTLKKNVVRKKNLEPGKQYTFRVRARDKIDWGPYVGPVTLQALREGLERMAAPRLECRGPKFVAVAWEPVEGAEKYKLEMRKEGESRWYAVGQVGGTSAKKKNLVNGEIYYFRVRPQGAEVDDSTWAWSPGSEALSPLSLPPAMASLLGSQLIRNDGTTVAVDELAGKVIGVYCSASWCGPCHQFTGLLSPFYIKLKALGKAFEIVFASADHDEASMKSYFSQMPWLAIPYDAGERENLMATHQVRSIPRLIIFSAEGVKLEDNAAGQQYLTEGAFATWERGLSLSAAAAGSPGKCCGGGKCSG